MITQASVAQVLAPGMITRASSILRKRELTTLFVFDIGGTYLDDIISICDEERSS